MIIEDILVLIFLFIGLEIFIYGIIFKDTAGQLVGMCAIIIFSSIFINFSEVLNKK